MSDAELRELCMRYFDGIQRRDLDAGAERYAPVVTLWVNLSGADSPREPNLATLRDGYGFQVAECKGTCDGSKSVAPWRSSPQRIRMPMMLEECRPAIDRGSEGSRSPGLPRR